MDYNKITRFEIVIGNSFTCGFDAWKHNTENGIIYREKSFYKNESELCYISLIEKNKAIVLAIGNFTFNFIIITGNTENLEGDYNVLYGSESGTIKVIEL